MSRCDDHAACILSTSLFTYHVKLGFSSSVEKQGKECICAAAGLLLAAMLKTDAMGDGRVPTIPHASRDAVQLGKTPHHMTRLVSAGFGGI